MMRPRQQPAFVPRRTRSGRGLPRSDEAEHHHVPYRTAGGGSDTPPRVPARRQQWSSAGRGQGPASRIQLDRAAAGSDQETSVKYKGVTWGKPLVSVTVGADIPGLSTAHRGRVPGEPSRGCGAQGAGNHARQEAR
jgi:hypothetical protein